MLTLSFWIFTALESLRMPRGPCGLRLPRLPDAVCVIKGRMLVHNPQGHYSFLQGIAPYSAGVIADPGYAIEHARFAAPLPLAAGFAHIKAHLKALGLPLQSLCSMALRSPKPFSFQGFNDFNASYIEVLQEWGLFLKGANPVARTNVAPEVAAPAEPSLYSFGYTVPFAGKEKSFVVAGAGELPEGSLKPADVIRRGETSPEALREKARFVMDLMSGRLAGLGATWNEVTVIDIYTVHSIAGFVREELVDRMGRGQLHGLTWHYSRPPIVTIEYEMDLRRCLREVLLPGSL